MFFVLVWVFEFLCAITFDLCYFVFTVCIIRFGVCRYCFAHMENKILTPHLSTSSDLRQRRQKIVTSDLKSEDDVDDGDNSDVGDIDDHSKLSSSVSAAGSLWFYWLRLCIGLVIMLMCGWGYASYVKQLHETHLWFSNIQVSCLLLQYLGAQYRYKTLILVHWKSCFVHCAVLLYMKQPHCFYWKLPLNYAFAFCIKWYLLDQVSDCAIQHTVHLSQALVNGESCCRKLHLA